MCVCICVTVQIYVYSKYFFTEVTQYVFKYVRILNKFTWVIHSILLICKAERTKTAGLSGNFPVSRYANLPLNAREWNINDK